MGIYMPREDSFLLRDILKKYLKNKSKDLEILDMGTGSGILSETAKRLGFKNILAVDINPEAVKEARKKKIESKSSDLFSDILKKFDLIVFNPPYLPESEYDKEKDTTGGERGDETILKFLRQAKKHLNKTGEILLLLSSLTPRERIEQELNKQNLKKKKLAEKRLFFENLEIWIIKV